MAKFMGMEILKTDLEQAGKVLNSRMGMAFLMWAAFNSPWGVTPKIDALIRINDRMASSIEEARVMSANNHDILVRLMERCEFTRCPDKAKTQGNDGYTARLER